MSKQAQNLLKVRGYAIYAMVQRPNTSGEKPQFIINLLPESKEEEQKLLNNHLFPTAYSRENPNMEIAGQFKKASTLAGMENIKTTGRDVYFVFKRDVTSKDGAVITPPVVVDSNAQPTKVLIGNGSLVEVTLSLRSFKTKFQATDRTAATLEAVQILTLVPYEGSNSSKADRLGLKPQAGTFVDASDSVPFDTDDNTQSVLG